MSDFLEIDVNNEYENLAANQLQLQIPFLMNLENNKKRDATRPPVKMPLCVLFYL
jgi:hypothetical protein